MAGERADTRALIQQLLDGDGSTNDELRDVSAFFDNLRAAAGSAASQSLEDHHIAAMATAFRSGHAGPEGRRPFPVRPRLTRRALVRSLSIKVGIASLVVLTGGAALAATGNLPALQDHVADAVDFAVDLPGGTDEPKTDRSVNPSGNGEDDGPRAASRPARSGGNTGADSDEESGSGRQSVRGGSESQHAGPGRAGDAIDDAEEPEVEDTEELEPTDEPEDTDEPDQTDAPDPPEETEREED